MSQLTFPLLGEFDGKLLGRSINEVVQRDKVQSRVGLKLRLCVLEKAAKLEKYMAKKLSAQR